MSKIDEYDESEELMPELIRSKLQRAKRCELWAKMTSEEFVAEVLATQARGDDAIAEILVFGMHGRTPDYIERCLGLVDIQRSSIQALVGWLTASLSIADRSEVRNQFYERVGVLISASESAERTEGLLKGLGPRGAAGARWGRAVLSSIVEDAPEANDDDDGDDDAPEPPENPYADEDCDCHISPPCRRCMHEPCDG